MFYKSIQCPSVAALSLAFFCVAHAATADAKVYSVTDHGKGTKSTYKTDYDSSELVNSVSELHITVPRFGEQNYVEIKADFYYKLPKNGTRTYLNNGYFDYKMTELTHGGHFGKERFTLHVWCLAPGAYGYIGRKNEPRKGSPLVGSVYCEQG